MEEEDEALARQIYEEELRAAAAAQPQVNPSLFSLFHCLSLSCSRSLFSPSV
jgi:hypothetical protein